MVRQHHQLNGHESEQTLGDGEGQGSLACRSPWSRRVRYDLATEQQQAPMISKYQSTAPSSLPSSRPSIPPQNCHASNCVYQKSHHCFIFPIFVDDIAIHLFSLSQLFNSSFQRCFGDMHWGHNSKHSEVPSLMNLVCVGEMDYS